MNSAQLLVGAVIGGSAGMMAGVLGLGGGIIIPPLVTLLLGVSQHVAQATSLAALLPPVGLPALFGYRRQGIAVRWSMVGWLIASFAIFGALGGTLARGVDDRPLRVAFIVVLAFVFVQVLAPVFSRGTSTAPPASRPRVGPWPAVGIGLIGGLASGMFGIGGGVLMLPLLMRWAKLDRLSAQATSIAMMLAPVGLPAVLVYGKSTPLPWPLIVAVALGFSVGALLGGRIAPKIPARIAALLFASVLAASAVAMILKLQR